MHRPELAVCIPTYNRAEILAERLERLRGLQRRIALEVCISDNASTDATPAVIKRFSGAFARLRYRRHSRPLSHVLNFFVATRLATSPYVLTVGDDDAVVEESVCRALALLTAEPDLQAVLGNAIDYVFAEERPVAELNFITQAEQYSLSQADIFFNKYYFLEYQVLRRSAIEAHYYNEGMSYPGGWRIIHAALRRGPIRLEPMPLVLKGVTADQAGSSNYVPELGALMRADLEWFAAEHIPEMPSAGRAPLVEAALLRSVRYSSDSTISANGQKQYLAALHHAQKAALYAWNTSEYPRVPLDELIYGRLGDWLRQALAAAPDCTDLVLEDHPACRKLWTREAEALPQIRDCRIVPRQALEVVAGSWTVSFAFESRLSGAALRIPGAPYCALLDLLRNSTATPWELARLTGTDDGIAVADDDWNVASLALSLPELAAGRAPLVRVDLADGAPIASGDGAGSPDRAFDDDPDSFWISVERREAVKDHAWLGYGFAAPHAIAAIGITQDLNPGYRQDCMRVEKSPDGGETWESAAPAPFRLRGGRTTVALPPGEPSRMWRIVAAGDNATEPDHGWSVMRLEFFESAEFIPAPLVPIDLSDGAPIASSDGGGSPDRAFDGDPDSFWISAERREAVKDHAWLGYGFAAPHAIAAIGITQDLNPGYRQDCMRVEKSRDGGETWESVASAPFRLRGGLTTVALPSGEPARMWRVVAAGDNATEPDHGWSVMRLEFFESAGAVPAPLVPIDLADGAPIASGDGGGSPDRAFDDDPVNFWISAERCDAVKGRAWLGYSFAAPQAVVAIRITQDTNPGYRQDRMSVEKSLDGGEIWQPAAPGPFRLTGGRTTVDLPVGEPARMWRIVAAGDNATEPDHGWTVMAAEFFAREKSVATPLAPASLANGAAIASGDGAGSPDRAFDGDPATFWISAERREAVKDHAWIGYNFAKPQAIGAIRVTQDTNAGYHQDRMRVEKSRDGETWEPAAPGSFRLIGSRTTVDLPAGRSARMWRLVAAGDNATEPDHGWTVMAVEFFCAPGRRRRKRAVSLAP